MDWLGMALDTLGVTARRDKITIMGDLLDIIQEPRRVTHILYKSNMSYVQLLKYLENLKDLGLAEERTKPFRSFMITENGKTFKSLIMRNDSPDSHSK
jgi:predicted transcriptional regulator